MQSQALMCVAPVVVVVTMEEKLFNFTKTKGLETSVCKALAGAEAFHVFQIKTTSHFSDTCSRGRKSIVRPLISDIHGLS